MGSLDAVNKWRRRYIPVNGSRMPVLGPSSCAISFLGSLAGSMAGPVFVIFLRGDIVIGQMFWGPRAEVMINF